MRLALNHDGVVWKLLVMTANTVLLPAYVAWFGLHELPGLLSEIAYGWKHTGGRS